MQGISRMQFVSLKFCLPLKHNQEKYYKGISENDFLGKMSHQLVPNNPKQWTNSKNEELGLVSSFINNGTDGCLWVLNQNKT